MKDNTIEIRDDDINVEEIMEKIRENIRRRKASGELSPDSDSAGLSSIENCQSSGLNDAIQRDLSYINTNWGIHNNSYFISSHHPHIGKFLVKGRQLVHGEVRRYVDPMISRQTVLNASTARIATHIYREQIASDQKVAQSIHEAVREIEGTQKAEIESAMKNIELITSKTGMQINEMTARIPDLVRECVNTRLQNQFRELLSLMDEDIRSRTWLAHLLEERIAKGRTETRFDQKQSPAEGGTNYPLFEDHFRGSREAITHRQLEFLPYFENCSHVLDIGCGRGEFLEILMGRKIGGIGVDLDADMVSFCRSRQLNVTQSDAITYLERLDDTSIDGIFIDQVVEHLEPEYLVRLLALCYQKMKFGSYIVIETVNPLSFVSLANFYIDMTHKRPVHPETLQYLMSASGFQECEKKFSSQVSDEGRLKKIEWTSEMNGSEKKNIEVYNHNVEMLNTVLFGAQDYAVIGKK